MGLFEIVHEILLHYCCDLFVFESSKQLYLFDHVFLRHTLPNLYPELSLSNLSLDKE